MLTVQPISCIFVLLAAVTIARAWRHLTDFSIHDSKFVALVTFDLRKRSHFLQIILWRFLFDINYIVTPSKLFWLRQFSLLNFVMSLGFKLFQTFSGILKSRKNVHGLCKCSIHRPSSILVFKNFFFIVNNQIIVVAPSFSRLFKDFRRKQIVLLIVFNWTRLFILEYLI